MSSVIHPIPNGTRDVLPDETRELRAITDALRASFEHNGFGEIFTPALEYESELARGGVQGGRYRVFDDSGAALVLRTDMTVPIARVVATRYATAPMPQRFSYLAHCYRAVRPQRGQQRELLQAGIELIGAPAPEGTAEALTVLCDALEAVGLRRYRIGLGDAALFPALLAGHGVDADTALALRRTLGSRDFVALGEALAELPLEAEVRDRILRLAQTRGGDEVLGDEDTPALAGLRAVRDILEPEVRERVIFDLGLAHEIGYYTGAVFEVYDPELGTPIGGGGRYDDLLGRFGRALPAVGFALGVERLHLALAGEER